MIIRNEVLQEEVANERKGREHYQQLSDHFKAEIDKANERLNGVMDVSKKQCDKTAIFTLMAPNMKYWTSIDRFF